MKLSSKLGNESGFTLLEIIVVICILGIVAAISVPGLRTWKQNSDLNADIRRVYGFFQKARLEAVKQNGNCSITFAQVDENGDFFDYYSFIDVNGNNEYEPAEDTVVVAGNLTTGITIFSNNFPINADGLNTATFNQRGLIGGDGGSTIMGATIVMLSSSGLRHSLVFNRHGRMRIQ